VVEQDEVNGKEQAGHNRRHMARQRAGSEAAPLGDGQHRQHRQREAAAVDDSRDWSGVRKNDQDGHRGDARRAKESLPDRARTAGCQDCLLCQMFTPVYPICDRESEET
jgi:hypothetical protein